MIIRPRHKQYSHGSVVILIIIAVMALVLIIMIVTAAALVGDRTGVGSGTTNPGGGGTPIVPVSGVCPSVQTIDQINSGWCGRASQAQIIAFWQGNYAYYSTHLVGLSAATLNSLSGKSYRYTNSAQDVVNSLKSGKPVIAYTTLYRSNHIIVLTCYDDETQTFTANDSEPRGRGGQQSTQKIGGVQLTLSNLTGPYNGASYYGHPEFLVTN